MRPQPLVALTALLAAAALAAPSSAAAGRTKPPTDLSSAPASWTDTRVPTFELYGQVEQPRTARDEAHLSATEWGLRYVAGAGDNDVVVTEEAGRLVFHDRAVSRWIAVPLGCERVPVGIGRAVSCAVPVTPTGEVFLEMWPRLGADTVDTSALPSRYRTWALTDAGRDVVRTGAGRDFVNTAADQDEAHGGAGDDWIRMGGGGNVAYGDDGDDKLVGGQQGDTLYGGEGTDSVGGLAGDDVLHGGAGDDVLAGKVGYDTAYREGADKLRNIDVVY
ncbi:calcium-binding protein [Nocardioides sp. AX2bis]|uniref:calcium-binding protein n=1 Tax=Nocardioides sp. AX2bis TaxID=2653157 RepID=UPI0012F1AADD|nr:calcium-binding protein [Nocardioides sp. AX2bis]VXC43554.1 conserved exported hypothetical protein [Nocardioides sp. AX2bis]